MNNLTNSILKELNESVDKPYGDKPKESEKFNFTRKNTANIPNKPIKYTKPNPLKKVNSKTSDEFTNDTDKVANLIDDKKTGKGTGAAEVNTKKSDKRVKFPYGDKVQKSDSKLLKESAMDEVMKELDGLKTEEEFKNWVKKNIYDPSGDFDAAEDFDEMAYQVENGLMDWNNLTGTELYKDIVKTLLTDKDYKYYKLRKMSNKESLPNETMKELDKLKTPYDIQDWMESNLSDNDYQENTDIFKEINDDYTVKDAIKELKSLIKSGRIKLEECDKLLKESDSSNPRRATDDLISAIDDGFVTWEQVGMACLKYMSEDDVKDMCRLNDFEIADDEDLDDEDDLDECKKSKINESTSKSKLSSTSGDKSKSAIKFLIDDENEAIEGYESKMKDVDDKAKDVFKKIIGEEKNHIKLLNDLKK